jgi:hypothetical protein
MPIQVNLLAEQLALEEQRRRDPVKRAVWIAGLVVVLAVGWSLVLQIRILRTGSSLAGVQARFKQLEAQSKAAADHLRSTAEIERRLKALQILSTNRFLWANLLNELQHTVVEQVQVMRIKGDQSYLAHTPPPAPAKPAEVPTGSLPSGTGAGGKKTKTAVVEKPVPVSEKITITIEAKDFANPSDLNHNKFMSAIAGMPLFKGSTRKADAVSLKDRMPPQPDPASPSRNFILFSIECRTPDKERVL